MKLLQTADAALTIRLGLSLLPASSPTLAASSPSDGEQMTAPPLSSPECLVGGDWYFLSHSYNVFVSRSKTQCPLDVSNLNHRLILLHTQKQPQTKSAPR